LRSSFHNPPLSADRWTYSPSLSFQATDPPGLLHLDTHLMPSRNPERPNLHEYPTALALDCAPNGPVAAHQPYNNVSRVPTALQPVYQQAPGPVLFHNGGVLPPSAWPEVNLASYTNGINPRASAYHNLYNTPAFHYYGSDRFVAPVSTVNPRPSYDQHPAAIQVPSQKLESLTLDSARYEVNEPHAHGTPSPTRLREKVLTHAHRSYAELLAYLHQCKKSPNRSSAGPRATSRMIIFPKLPRSSSYPSSASALQPNQAELDYPSNRGANVSLTSQAELHAVPKVQSVNKHHFQGAKDLNPALYHAFGMDDLRTHDSSHLLRDRVPVTPVTSAKAAIELLTHLCEQSEWKWIDGMLLGGCLHYGLERYEQSLEWFQRIISLDGRYVFELT
jgi:hypothetical protein